jgi:hypothetical protein
MIDLSSDLLRLTYRYSVPGYRPFGLGVCSNAVTTAPALSRRRPINAEWVNWGTRWRGWRFRVKLLTFALLLY